MASIIKRGASYRICVSLGYDADGKQIRKSTTYRPPDGTPPRAAQKQAEKFALEFEMRCCGHLELRENMRFAELAEWYFEHYAPNRLKPSTQYTYRAEANRNLLPAFGNLRLKDFTPARITQFFGGLALSPASCKKLYCILQSIFTCAVNQGFLVRSPCEHVILPKAAPRKKPFLDDTQARQLLEMCREYSQFNIIIKVLLYTGMRSGECLALRWADVDFERHILRIEHTLADACGRHYLQPPKTPSSRRYLAMAPELEEALWQHYMQQKRKKLTVGPRYAHPEMVFTSERGCYLDRSRLNSRFKRFIQGTGFEFATLHSLRHCNATLLIAAGFDLKIVSEHLGHSSVAITADTYADVIASTKAKVADHCSLALEA